MTPPPELTEPPLHGFRGDTDADPPARPRGLTVAISRQSGARGPEVARKVAAILTWQVYDHDTLDYLARDDAARAQSVLGASGHNGAVIVDDGTVTVDLTDADSAVVIRELVTAGVSVRGFSQSTRLEDVFLDLVHRDNPGSDTSKDRS